MNKHEWQDAVISTIKQRLEDMGIETALVHQPPADALRSAYTIAGEKNIILDMFFSKFDYSLPIFQMYFYVEENLNSEHRTELVELIQRINIDTPIGGFGISDEVNHLYYKQAIMFKLDDDLDSTANSVLADLDLMLQLVGCYDVHFKKYC